MTINYYKKNVYGNDLLYPKTFADEILALTGKKTLTPQAIKALQAMGFKFVQVLN